MASHIALMSRLMRGGKTYGGLRAMADFCISANLVVVPGRLPEAVDHIL